jgi:hypothetical protein
MIFVLLGVQVWFIGLFAKVFSYTEPVDHQARSGEQWLGRVTLDARLRHRQAIDDQFTFGDVSVGWCSSNRHGSDEARASRWPSERP